jgi:hypothetical protein
MRCRRSRAVRKWRWPGRSDPVGLSPTPAIPAADLRLRRYREDLIEFSTSTPVRRGGGPSLNSGLAGYPDPRASPPSGCAAPAAVATRTATFRNVDPGVAEEPSLLSSLEALIHLGLCPRSPLVNYQSAPYYSVPPERSRDTLKSWVLVLCSARHDTSSWALPVRSRAIIDESKTEILSPLNWWSRPSSHARLSWSK